jgi:hypothetical protein
MKKVKSVLKRRTIQPTSQVEAQLCSQEKAGGRLFGKRNSNIRDVREEMGNGSVLETFTLVTVLRVSEQK